MAGADLGKRAQWGAGVQCVAEAPDVAISWQLQREVEAGTGTCDSSLQPYARGSDSLGGQLGAVVLGCNSSKQSVFSLPVCELSTS